MKHLVQTATFATIALGALFSAPTAQAAVTGASMHFNGPAVCQAFTPGPTNTIRNRVLGAENVGTSTVNVACDLISRLSTGSTALTGVSMWFSNNNPSGTITVTCTVLTGYQTGPNQAFTRTANVTVGSQSNISFAPTDFGSSLTEFPGYLAGVNCALPPGGVINDIHTYQNEENGVGS